MKPAMKPFDYDFCETLKACRCHLVVPAIAGLSQLGGVLENCFGYTIAARDAVADRVNHLNRVTTLFPRANVTIIPWVGQRPPKTEQIFIEQMQQVFAINEKKVRSHVLVLDFRGASFNSGYFEKHFAKNFTAADLGACIQEVQVIRDYAHELKFSGQAAESVAGEKQQ